jgi:hypothetical protein
MASQPWKYSDYCTPNYIQIPGILRNIATSGNSVWGVNPQNEPFSWDGTNWTKFPGSLSQVAICYSGDVYAIDHSDNIFKLQNNSWRQLPGLLRSIACGFDGDSQNAFYGINGAGQVFKLGLGEQWQLISGPPATLSLSPGSIAVGVGKVYALDVSGRIFSKALNGGWELVPGLLKVIAAGDGGVVGVNSGNQLFRWTGSSWVYNPERQFTFVALNRRMLYGVALDGLIYQKTLSTML